MMTDMAGISKARKRVDPQLFAAPVQPRESDERYTPRLVFDALGVSFDLDVAAPPGGVPWIPADRYYTAADDGLAQPWHGLVWCNPPYSNTHPWITRFVEHANGVILFPINKNASWTHRLLAAVPAAFMLEHLLFHYPKGASRDVPVVVALAGLGDGVAAVGQAANVLPGTLIVAVPVKARKRVDPREARE